ncbi:tetratricopeptide (TPR) repeat protein [Dysgonomonas sp. PH5-45]|uniref:transcriptional regulator n=1 Tax=unclassified Dysgonomonas TaxID=2630389 RepID=UPI00247415BE|nr:MULTISPECIES: LuxR family transcriptional regulator [unclassified Dysgonomonas]MDH6354954.1 tetratricopeptide (TPR) repeat protein [Dysgonomonas sp. PH5-45]MDH6387853.1 tetratricopeptide (TPR) repeat protein [Dysgonomonas sp. PH5-37]
MKKLTTQSLHFVLKIVFILILHSIHVSLVATPLQKFNSISEKIDEIHFSQGEQSRKLINELYKIAQTSPDSTLLLSQCLYKEAMVSYAQGTIDTTLTRRIKKQIKLIDKNKYPFENALLLYSLGADLSANGDYSDAFTASLEAVKQFKELDDSTFIAKSLNTLGTICSHISLFGMSKDYYEEALSWATSKDYEYNKIKLNIYRLNLLDDDRDSAIASLSDYISSLNTKYDLGLKITGYLNLGSFYLKKGDQEKSYHYWKIAENLIQNVDNPRLNSVLYQNMGVYYLLFDKDYEKALEYFTLSKQISERNNNLIHLASIYDIISQTYELTGNIDSAYVYLVEHQLLSQKLAASPKAIEAYQAYVSTFLEASKNELTIAEQQIKISNRQLITVVMIAVTLVLLALLLLQQKRLKENENRELTKQLDHEKKIKELQKKSQDEVIEAKSREIASYSLLLSNKNSILKEILNINTQLAKNKKDTEEYTKKINTIIKNNFQSETEWSDFKIHFEKVHPSFFDKLKQHRADLTENNLRICAYYRLGMSTKQIAQILHITPASVSIHRHRIKKKLGLGEEDGLDDFLRNI